MEKSKKIVSGALMLSVTAILVKIFGVIYKVPLSYILTEEGMGYFNSAYTVYSFFYILASAGVPKAVAMLITEIRESNGTEYAKKVVKKCIIIFSCIGSVLTLIFLFSARVFSWFIGNIGSLESMLSIAPSIFFISVSGVFRGYLNSAGRLFPIALSQLVESVFKLVIGIAFAYLGKSMNFSIRVISALSILGITIGSVISFFILMLFLKIKDSGEKTGQNVNISLKHTLYRISKVAIPISLTSSISSITGMLDLSCIMRRLEDVGYSESAASSLYGNYTTLVLPMFNLVISVLSPIATVILPILITKRLQRDERGFSDIFSNSLLLTNLACAPCVFVFYLYSFEILDILFLSSSSATGAPMLSLICPGIYLLSILTIFNTVHEAMHNIKYSVLSLLVGSAVKIVLSYILIGNSSFGIMGACISTVASYAVSLFVSVVFLVRERVKIYVFSTSILPLLISALAFLPPYFLLYRSGFVGYDLPSLLFLLFVSIMMFLLLSILFYRKSAERVLLTISPKNKMFDKNHM